jgi:hypothetical protein
MSSPKKLVGWKACYDNGVDYSSAQYAWDSLPLFGLLVVVEFYSDGSKEKHYNKDYYVLDTNKIFGTNNIHPYLTKLGTVKQGRWCDNAMFAEAIKRADEALCP